jgi:hypothetical protein
VDASTYDYLGDAGKLEDGTIIIFPDRERRASLPRGLIERAVRANTVYLGHDPENPDGVYLIFVVGETAIRLRLTETERALYGGMLLGISGWYPRKEQEDGDA